MNSKWKFQIGDIIKPIEKYHPCDADGDVYRVIQINYVEEMYLFRELRYDAEYDLRDLTFAFKASKMFGESDFENKLFTPSLWRQLCQ